MSDNKQSGFEHLSQPVAKWRRISKRWRKLKRRLSAIIMTATRAVDKYDMLADLGIEFNKLEKKT